MQHSRDTLAERDPFLASQWSALNEKTPSDVSPFSNKYALWECSRGHTWKSRINNRVSKQTGCPYCSGIIPIAGETDLKTLFPFLAEQWHSTRNDTAPEDYLPKSNKKVWWHCPECGMDWAATIYHRTEGRGCPYCAGKYPILGKTDLKTIYPVLAKQWDYAKNGSCKPEDYTAQSHFKAHWVCDRGHTWEAAICKMVNAYAHLTDATKAGVVGCPVCGGKKLVIGENDLLSTAPYLAAQWDYEKNTDLLPEQVMLHCNTPVWCRCDNGHSWKASPNNRSTNTGCPYCKNHKLIPTENSLLVVNPDLAKQWDHERNTPVTAADVTAFNNNTFWWICNEGHRWMATVSNRSKGEGCPYCSGRKAIPGVNSFDVYYPEIAGEWHPSKNGSMLPSDFSLGSNKIVWWRCGKGHEWQATIFDRVNGSECPKCKGAKDSTRKLVK